MATFTSNTQNDFRIRLVTTVKSQSTSNNNTVLEYKAYLLQGINRFNNSSNSGHFTINGTKVYTVPTTFNSTNWNKNTDILLKSGSLPIPHNSDGTKKISVSGQWKSAGGTYAPTNLTFSGTQTLPNIARGATITSAPDFNDEQNPTIVYANPAGSSVTTLQAGIYGTDGKTAFAAYRNVNKTGTLSYTFNLTNTERDALRSAFPNAKTMKVRFYLRTVIGGQTIIENVEKTVSLVNAEPDLSTTYKDLNERVTAVTGDDQLFVKGVSNIEVTALVTPKKAATIKEVKIGAVKVTDPYAYVYEQAELDTVSVTVTDSRGYVTTSQITFEYVAYEPLEAMASFYRTAATNNEVALTFDGTFFDENIGATPNTVTARYRYQPELGEWSDWIPVNVVTGEGAFSNEGDAVALGTIFRYNLQYRFEFEVSDAIDSVLYTYIVRTGRNILKVTEMVQVLQGKLHVQKLFTKDDRDFVFDFVYDIVTRTWVLHVYGLPQLFEPQHVFQSDVNTRTIVTVLNKDNFPLLLYTLSDSSDNFVDYINIDKEAPFNNHTLLDTGICPLPEVLEKRARELQFVTYSTNTDKLEFFVSAYVDSRNVSSTEETFIDWISDPTDPNYGKLYVVEEEVANVYGETFLDKWLIDMSKFPKTGLVRSHLRVHGKGLFFRATIVNRDKLEHELSGITWVYRLMSAR